VNPAVAPPDARHGPVFGRATCANCLRPQSVCYCRHLTRVPTATRVVLLQHPRERDVAIGTARMASLCLPNSELHVGVDWSASAPLARALADATRRAALLYPGETAADVLRDPPRGPLTLVVVDGTWAQAKKVVRQNPILASLPRYAFTPPEPSQYRIRREPSLECVSTIEALVLVLGAVEGDAQRFQALLAPFRAMIDAQLDCEARFRGTRSRHARRARTGPPPLPFPKLLRDRARDVVCIAGEANAWPYGSKERAAHATAATRPAGANGTRDASGGPRVGGYADELVHWVARRVVTGETFGMFVAPRNPLAAGTVGHCGIPDAVLRGGAGLAEFQSAWRAFVRDTDILCGWGPYVHELLDGAGAFVPERRFDLRAQARLFLHGPAGSPSDFAARVMAPAAPSTEPGRAGERLAKVVAVADYFLHGP
jgi:DTW domain-containing protein YfiP